MPISKSAIKRARQAEKHRARNVSTKKTFRGAIKSFLTKPSIKGLQEAQSEIDTAVKKKVLAKNTASRKKAQLAKIAKEAGVKAAAKAVAKPAVKKAETKPVAKKATTPAPAKKAVAKPATKKPAVATKKPVAKKTTK